jgi:hypothetical protein
MFILKLLGALALVAILAIAHWYLQPPMRIKPQAAGVLVDPELLGEYPENVSHLRLTALPEGRVTWELRGFHDPQLGRVPLKIGENPVQPFDIRHGDYEELVPRGRKTFAILAGHRYRIDLWGLGTNWFTKSSGELQLPAVQAPAGPRK